MVDKIKYAGEEAVSRIADYVNQKLKFVSTMPASPADGEAVLYIGTPTEDYQQGGVYEYDETNKEWILRNLVQVVELTRDEYENLTPAEKNNGVIYLVTDENFLDATEITRAEYEALTPEEKYSGTIYFITDENLPGSIVEGFYNESDGKFYVESTYTTEIAGVEHIIYISVDTNIMYRYNVDEQKFVMIGGAEEDPELVHVSDLPSLSNVENKIYMIGYASKSVDVDPASEEKILAIFPEDILSDRGNNTWDIESNIFKIYISPWNEGDRYLVSMSHDGSVWTFTDYASNTYNITMSDNVEFNIADTRKYYLGDETNHKLEQFFVPPIIPKEVVTGYFNSEDGKFYKESTYTTEISGQEGVLYITLDTNYIYRYDSTETEFIQIGGNGNTIVYVDTLPAPPDIKDAIYGYYSTVSYTKTVATDFLDDNQYFDKIGNDYIPKSDVDLTISSDDITYKTLVSLVLNGIDYDATYDDTTTHTFADGDAFYYKVGSMKFYAGSKDDQILYLLSNSGGGGESSGGTIEGYYNNEDGKFYQEETFTTEIPGQVGMLYVDLSENKTYRYDESEMKFIVVGGGGIEYQAGFGIDITDDTIKTTDFVGTQAEWDALTTAEKEAYDFVHITDDTTNVNYSPGHAISDGTSEKTQREVLEFNGFDVTDDSVNGKTKIAEVPYTAGDGIEITNKEVSVGDEISRTWTGTKAEWDAISDKSIYDGWIINITDDAAVGSGPVVDVVEDGNLNAVTSNAVYEALQNIGPGKTLVPWAQASDSEVAAMINAYYNDELTLTEIQSVWHVGDIRTITLGSIGAIGVGESHRSQNVDIVILDFEHDDLTTAINGHTKALITVQLKDCLRDETVADDGGKNNTENGYMNDTDTNVGGWTNSKRRAWCNNYFYNAIPASMRTLIKPVNKLTSAGNQSATINTDSDKCFLVSEIEIFGSVTYSKTGEGNQYNYFETESNRYKLPLWNSSSSSNSWWERSPYGSNSTYFCRVTNNGAAAGYGASYARGLAPAWCL